MRHKIRNRFFIYRAVAGIFCVAICSDVLAQVPSGKKPLVIQDWEIYQKQAGSDSTRLMVELRSRIPALVYDLRYAGTNNFIQQQVYPEGTNETFLRLPVVMALLKVQLELNKKNLGLKIFDAYRPYGVTVKFWELVKDERYVANPAKGSGHNRGAAVDVTIINLQSGEELNMGTGFDNFSDTAHHTFRKLPKEVLQNRLSLKTVMEKNGFTALNTEWWHYLFTSWSRFELLDIDFEKLKPQL